MNVLVIGGTTDRAGNVSAGHVSLLTVIGVLAALAVMAGGSATAAGAEEQGSALHDKWVGDAGNEPEGVPIHHYSENSQGANTVIEYPSGSETTSPEVQPLATVSWVPFGWTINFDSSLKGRNMKSSTGVFCQRFKSNYNTGMGWIQITLIRNVSVLPDVYYATKNFRATGVWSERKCWSQHDASKTYHFQYNVRPGYIGHQVVGKGYASK